MRKSQGKNILIQIYVIINRKRIDNIAAGGVVSRSRNHLSLTAGWSDYREFISVGIYSKDALRSEFTGDK